jgi:biopolymer transport protein ExbD
MRMPTAARIWVSAFLLCAGLLLFPTFNRWVETRTWVAVDMPISLAPGHVRTGSFPVNLNSDYQIVIELDDYPYGNEPECEEYKVIQTHWWLYRDGRASSSWVDDWRNRWGNESTGAVTGSYLGAFDSSPGLYTLDVEIVADATCLLSFHPRLRVSTDKSDYAQGGWIRAVTLLASCALFGISFALLLVGSLESDSVQVTRGESLAIFNTLRAERELARRKLHLMGPESSLPSIGYLYAVTCLVLFLTMAPLILGKSMQSSGIPARLLRPDVIHASSDGEEMGLLVYVDLSGKLYLNSKPVTAEELPRALEDEFARRADCLVYVEGDLGVQFQAVAQAMDLIRGAHGEVIMLTPSMRAEAQTGHD